MSNKKVNANWYTKTHTVYHNPPLKIDYGDYADDPIYLHKTIEESANGTLFAKGVYKTKILEADLPAWFCPAMLYHHDGWINVKKITDARYKPNMWINHLFKDDFLYMKFGGSIKNVGNPDFDYDLLVWGNDIIDVVAYIDAYRVLPESQVNQLKQSIKGKVAYYNQHFPNEHDAIALPRYEEIYENKYREVVAKINGTEVLHS